LFPFAVSAPIYTYYPPITNFFFYRYSATTATQKHSNRSGRKNARFRRVSGSCFRCWKMPRFGAFRAFSAAIGLLPFGNA
jgi:hypothetical protein